MGRSGRSGASGTSGALLAAPDAADAPAGGSREAGAEAAELEGRYVKPEGRTGTEAKAAGLEPAAPTPATALAEPVWPNRHAAVRAANGIAHASGRPAHPSGMAMPDASGKG